MSARSFVSLLLCVPLASGIGRADATPPDILEKGGIDGLVNALQEKNRHLEAGSHPAA